MADVQVDSIVEALGSISSRKDQLQKALTEFDGRKSVLAKFTLRWKELQDHFTDIEKVVNRQVDDLKSKEQAFEAKSKKLFDDFAKREEAIFQKEQTFVPGGQERKGLKGSAISAPNNNNSVNVEPQVLAATNDSSAQYMDLSLHATTTDNGAAKNALTNKLPLSEVEVNPELKALCKNMDSDGVRNYIGKQSKDIASLRTQLPSALQLAPEPSRLVLQALNSYPLQDNSHTTGKKDGSLVIARACITLLEALAKLLVDPRLGEAHVVVDSDVKSSAKEIANKWKSNMDFKIDGSSGGTINAQAFLQLLATFGIASEFDKDEICDLVVILARRKQTITLCKFLDLSSKIPDIVDKLCKEKRQIEALSFANAFGIMYQLQPTVLLKDYLKEARKSAHSMPNTPVGKHNTVVKELSALKAVLRCIEEYKLGAQYSPTPLQRRVEQLEKFLSDKKRAADDLKTQSKRPKVSGPSGIQTGSVLDDGGPRKATDKQDLTSSSLSLYGLSAQTTYSSIMPSASYTALVGGCDPLSLSRSYLPSNNALGSQLYGSSDLTHKGGRDPLLSSSYLQSGSTPGSQLYRSSDLQYTSGRDPLPLSSAYRAGSTLGSQVYGSPYSKTSTYNSYQFGGGLPPPPPAYQSSFKY